MILSIPSPVNADVKMTLILGILSENRFSRDSNTSDSLKDESTKSILFPQKNVVKWFSPVIS